MSAAASPPLPGTRMIPIPHRRRTRTHTLARFDSVPPPLPAWGWGVGIAVTWCFGLLRSPPPLPGYASRREPVPGTTLYPYRYPVTHCAVTSTVTLTRSPGYARYPHPYQVRRVTSRRYPYPVARARGSASYHYPYQVERVTHYPYRYPYLVLGVTRYHYPYPVTRIRRVTVTHFGSAPLPGTASSACTTTLTRVGEGGCEKHSTQSRD